MATIQRPVKTYGTRKYVTEVSASPSNLAPIQSNEVDDDLDTVFAAWNGGADAVNIKDGAVATAKLADAPNGVSTVKINDGAVTTPKLATAPNGVATANLNDLAVTTSKLANGAVTGAKLAVNAALYNFNSGTGLASFNHTNVAGAESVPVLSCAVLTAGGFVHIEAHPSFYVQATGAVSASVVVTIKRDGAFVFSRRFDLTIPGASGIIPLGGLAGYDSPPSGNPTYTVTAQLFSQAGAALKTPDTTPGYIHVLVFV